MRGWAVSVGLAWLCLALTAVTARADNVVAVTFFGYQSLNGKMLFQIHVDGVAPEDQPPLLTTGARLKFGPYQIGAFHEVHQLGKDPATGLQMNVDASTLELINTETGAKFELPFRRKVELAPGAEMKQTLKAVRPSLPLA